MSSRSKAQFLVEYSIRGLGFTGFVLDDSERTTLRASIHFQALKYVAHRSPHHIRPDEEAKAA